MFPGRRNINIGTLLNHYERHKLHYPPVNAFEFVQYLYIPQDRGFNNKCITYHSREINATKLHWEYDWNWKRAHIVPLEIQAQLKKNRIYEKDMCEWDADAS